MNIEKSLTKETFWNKMMEDFPNATKLFCKWIDEYKEAVGWNGLFNDGVDYKDGQAYFKTSSPKYHDLPYAMQQGIWISFCFDQLHKYFEQPEYEPESDFAEEVKNVFAEIEPLVNYGE